MKVLHVTNAYPFPDIPEFGVFVKEQIAALARAGIRTDVLFINGRGEGKRAYWNAIARLRACAPDYDIIHCHHLYSAFVAALARVRKPAVVSFQNDWLREVEIQVKPLQAALCSLGVRYADRVIFKSPIPKQFQGQDKFVHLPNGVDEQKFNVTDKLAARARLGLDPDATYVLFVSSKYRDRPQKRYDRFARTLELLRERMPQRDIRELVMVNQPREKAIDFINAADLHLLCSDYEGSPNSVKEALCSGLPVVSTRVGNVEAMLADVPCCHVASSFDPAELAALADRSLSGSCERIGIREAFLEKKLTQREATAKLIQLYATLAPAASRGEGG